MGVVDECGTSAPRVQRLVRTAPRSSYGDDESESVSIPEWYGERHADALTASQRGDGRGSLRLLAPGSNPLLTEMNGALRWVRGRRLRVRGRRYDEHGTDRVHPPPPFAEGMIVAYAGNSFEGSVLTHDLDRRRGLEITRPRRAPPGGQGSAARARSGAGTSTRDHGRGRTWRAGPTRPTSRVTAHHVFRYPRQLRAANIDWA